MADEPGRRTAAVVLAAGEARRFGGPKLLERFGSSTVIGCVVWALRDAGADPIVVVVPVDRGGVDRALAGHSVRLIQNPDPARGMLSSVQTGVASLPEEAERFLIALADQPRVGAEHIRRLLHEHEASGRGIAIPTHLGKRGHPVVFDRRYRDEILDMDTSRTLRDLTHAHANDIVEVEFSSDAVVRDIDTESDYQDELRRVDG